METQQLELKSFAPDVEKLKTFPNSENVLIPKMEPNTSAENATALNKKNIVVDAWHFFEVIEVLLKEKYLSLDTETTGLRSYHQDKIFSVIISNGECSYYFNFLQYENLNPFYCLPRAYIKNYISELFDKRNVTWFLHNAKFDLSMLAQEQCTLKGTIHCTQAVARLEDNTHLKYSLDLCAKRIGLAKDDKVEEFITKNKLYDWEVIPGRKQRSKLKHFDKVPFEIISEYGCQDARVTYQLGMHQIKALTDFSNTLPNGIPTPLNVMHNEREFTKTCFEIEQRGVLIDKEYCERASEYEKENMVKSSQEFERLTGTPFVNSAKVLGPIFKRLGEDFPKTDKGNDSFTKDVLDGFKSREAELVREFRKAEKRSSYFSSYLYYVALDGRVHPNVNQAAAKHGRVSNSNPNLQNVPKRGEDLSEFPVRRAIIPTPGKCLVMLDMDQVEYKMMVDYADQKDLIDLMKDGFDIHEACMKLMDLLDREPAKTMNFLKLYGGGVQRLADALGIDMQKARSYSDKYWERLTQVANFIQQVVYTAKTRGYIINWFGRICRFPDARFAFTAPNHLISGGCADVIKLSMNRISKFLDPYESKMIIQIHDELVFEMPEKEFYLIPKLKEIMETSYKHKHLPLTVSVDHSWKNWFDKSEGGPTIGAKEGNEVSKESTG